MISARREPEMQEPEAAGFVLAGGRSSRMGADKALLRFRGRPLIVNALEVLREAGLTSSIAGARSPSLRKYAQVIEDAVPDLGPLGGVCAALASTKLPHAVFLSVDLPLLPASLPAYLLHHAQHTGAAVTLCSVNGFALTFPAVVCPGMLGALRKELDTGRRGCFSAFRAASGRQVAVLPVEILIQAGQVAHPDGLPAVHWFLNMNTAEDLRRAELLFDRRNRVV